MPTDTVVSRGYLAPRAVDGVRGRVRATFDRCAFVTVDGGGPALVLHAAGHDHTPTSLCPASWPPAAIVVGDRVAGRAGHLKVGALVLDVRSARVWRPAPLPGLGDGRIATAQRAPLRPAGSRLGSVPLLRAAASRLASVHRPLLEAASRRTGELLPALERALTARDADRVAGCVASLVGRGPGLTPSGDDALVGALAVLHRLAAAGDPSTELLGRPVTAHLHRTGDISAHYLRLAAAGHLGERLVALCDALATGPTAAVDRAAAAVLATGATSGADALLGVVTAIRLLAASPRAVAA
jgi:hypothetical protein